MIITLRKSFHICIIFLILYIPLGDFFLKLLPVPENIYFLLRQFPDLLVILMTMIVISVILHQKYFIANKNILFLFIIFILYSISIIFINNSDTINALLNLKALIRYIFVIYLIFYIKPDENNIFLYLKTIIFIALIESIIGILEVIGGDTIKNIFKPRDVEDETLRAGITALRENSAFGTMLHTIDYSFFLLIALIITITMGRYIIKNQKISAVLIILFLYSIYLSDSRTAFFVAILSILLFMYFKYGINKKVIFISSLAIILLLILKLLSGSSSQNDLWFFMNPEYFEGFNNSRGGIIQYVFLQSITDPHIIYGLSSDKDFAVNYIGNKFNIPDIILVYLGNMLEDVYWVALSVYYGLIGMIIFITFLYIIYQYNQKLLKSNHITNFHENLLITVKILLLLLIPLNFFNQAFEVRTFSFYLWLLIGCAFILKLQYNKKNEDSISS